MNNQAEPPKDKARGAEPTAANSEQARAGKLPDPANAGPNPPSNLVPPAVTPGSRWTFPAALGLFLLLMGGGLSLDLGTKAYVFQHYWPYNQHPNDWPTTHEPHWYVDGVLGIQTSTNGGALFGMMQGYRMVFVTLSLAALVGLLVWLFLVGGWQDPWLLICLGLITGGILGNLYDRLGLWHEPSTPTTFHYHVRDWIHFRLQGVPMFDPWPNFNIADSLLVIGVACMLFHNLFFTPKPNT